MGLLDRLLAKERKSALDQTRAKAESGDAVAQEKLGLAYADGEGVTQDFGQAAKWFALAADQGRTEAQFFIGVLTDSGEGIA